MPDNTRTLHFSVENPVSPDYDACNAWTTYIHMVLGYIFRAINIYLLNAKQKKKNIQTKWKKGKTNNKKKEEMPFEQSQLTNLAEEKEHTLNKKKRKIKKKQYDCLHFNQEIHFVFIRIFHFLFALALFTFPF